MRGKGDPSDFNGEHPEKKRKGVWGSGGKKSLVRRRGLPYVKGERKAIERPGKWGKGQQNYA